MNNKPLATLTDEQKILIEQLATDKVNSMNSDQYLCDRIDEKVLEMEEHIQAYFHERFHFHMKKHEQK
ncbi:hypothetical protein ACFFLZ_16990 [Photobacterium aphoticum]|uniref:Uncharacterized protein n=2 Tax=Photobacterium TaxID=657 RepID=A0A0J1GLX7_9GAMM|nr:MULTISPECIES: hypothetical protein [Photobacterium]KLV00708.1 hypothetical protein ABT58_10750 [Photobacterium aphoticum]KLV04482.1 hypothetical protein ABT56_15230 [Photobacterium aquae]PSU58304.1 hypothetical protein C9I90_07275 [Photobacterium aphoticum]GHA50603.1 hypothetical protein GCM10007086_25480 [Photobacterium aphoticum]